MMEDKLTGFILAHENDDTAKLLLGRSRWPDIDMDLAVSTIEGRRRIKKKVPQWHEIPSMIYPTRLCTEQCSSAVTARYKAMLLSRLMEGRPGFRLADLTGGLGIDDWAFSAKAGSILYNEMDALLSQAAEHNFRELGIDNITVSNHEVSPATIDEVLGSFSPDVVFLDPARRDGAGRKVFLLEDCSPDILNLKQKLFDAAPLLMVKLSPMADISMAVERLNAAVPGNDVKEVHVVATDGECKELLLVAERGYSGPYTLCVAEPDRTEDAVSVAEDAEKASVPEFLQSIEELGGLKGSVLFEPGKALAKAGLFNHVSKAWGLRKLGRSTHLYVAQAGWSSPFGKSFTIEEVLPFSSTEIKSLSKRIPAASVTARNLPISSDDLRKKLKLKESSAIHIFACRIDTASGSGNYLLVTSVR